MHWRYLKRVGTAEKEMKTITLKHALTLFETIWNCRENNENKEAKYCVLVLFETYVWRLLFISASYILSCAISPLYQRRFSVCVWTEIVSSSCMSRLTGAHPSPIGLHVLLHFWVLYNFDFLEKVVGPTKPTCSYASGVLYSNM